MTAIETVTALRFKTRDAVARMIGRNGFISGGTIAQDERGFYVAGDFSVHSLVAALPTQAEVDARRAAEPVEPKAERKAPVRNIKNGACDLIRTWAKANPDATPAEGVAQFPDLNPSTVKIQMRKVRLGEV